MTYNHNDIINCNGHFSFDDGDDSIYMTHTSDTHVYSTHWVQLTIVGIVCEMLLVIYLLKLSVNTDKQWQLEVKSGNFVMNTKQTQRLTSNIWIMIYQFKKNLLLTEYVLHLLLFSQKNAFQTQVCFGEFAWSGELQPKPTCASISH